MIVLVDPEDRCKKVTATCGGCREDSKAQDRRLTSLKLTAVALLACAPSFARARLMIRFQGVHRRAAPPRPGAIRGGGSRGANRRPPVRSHRLAQRPLRPPPPEADRAHVTLAGSGGRDLCEGRGQVGTRKSSQVSISATTGSELDGTVAVTGGGQ